jgi:hypothetical protein
VRFGRYKERRGSGRSAGPAKWSPRRQYGSGSRPTAPPGCMLATAWSRHDSPTVGPSLVARGPPGYESLRDQMTRSPGNDLLGALAPRPSVSTLRCGPAAPVPRAALDADERDDPDETPDRRREHQRPDQQRPGWSARPSDRLENGTGSATASGSRQESWLVCTHTNGHPHPEGQAWTKASPRIPGGMYSGSRSRRRCRGGAPSPGSGTARPVARAIPVRRRPSPRRPRPAAGAPASQHLGDW